jgi:hypothetical protein
LKNAISPQKALAVFIISFKKKFFLSKRQRFMKQRGKEKPLFERGLRKAEPLHHIPLVSVSLFY